ncbi:MAG: Arc family DNA-binding protein [Gammaproteobacteria bacterium]|jgi:hypothetical protein
MNTVQDIKIDETQESGSRTADKFVVRLPKGMRQLIAEVAKNYHRSMNSEIVSRLESSLRVEPCLLAGEGEDNISNLPESETMAIEVNKQEYAIIERIRQLDTSKKEALVTLLSSLHSPS